LIEACHQTQFDRVLAAGENDWDRRRCGLGGERGRRATGGDHRYGRADQIMGQTRKALISALAPAVFKRNAALAKAVFGKAFAESGSKRAVRAG
jgi:hypothetical protein